MDKETLSNYGWIVICTLVLAVMLALATPFGEYVATGVQSAAQSFYDVNLKAMSMVHKEDDRSLISIEDFVPYSSTPSDYQFMFYKDNYLRFYQVANRDINNCKMQIKSCPIELKEGETYRLSFDVDNYYFSSQSYYSPSSTPFYFQQCNIKITDVNGYSTTKDIVVSGNGHYEFEYYCNTPCTVEYIRYGVGVYSNVEQRADISNFKLIEIEEGEDNTNAPSDNFVDNSNIFGNPISIEDFTHYSCSDPNYEYMFYKDNYLRFYQRAINGLGNCKMEIASCPIELEMDRTYRFSFDINDYYFSSQGYYSPTSEYFYFQQCSIKITDVNGYSTTKDIVISKNGHYEFEYYCNTPCTIEYIRYGVGVYTNWEQRANISNLELVMIS